MCIRLNLTNKEYKMNQVIATFKTEDGFTFYQLDNGKIVDNTNSNNVDMSWNSLDEFISSRTEEKLSDNNNYYLGASNDVDDLAADELQLNSVDGLGDAQSCGFTPYIVKDGELTQADADYDIIDLLGEDAHDEYSTKLYSLLDSNIFEGSIKVNNQTIYFKMFECKLNNSNNLVKA